MKTTNVQDDVDPVLRKRKRMALEFLDVLNALLRGEDRWADYLAYLDNRRMWPADFAPEPADLQLVETVRWCPEELLIELDDLDRAAVWSSAACALPPNWPR